MTPELHEPATVTEPQPDPSQKPITLTRRRIDKLLVAAGAVAAIVLAVAGGLLTWGSSFADDYVGDELRAQNIFFPDADALRAEGREDLLDFAGQEVADGDAAEAYAGYIDGHLQEVAEGQTYADLGSMSRAATAAVDEAVEAGASDDEVADLQATVDQIAGQRDTLFRGETLRGLLLSTFAWSTIGGIAFIASIVAYVAALAMAVFVIAGVVHLRGHHDR